MDPPPAKMPETPEQFRLCQNPGPVSEKSEDTRRGIQLWTRFQSWRRLPVGALNVYERGGNSTSKRIRRRVGKHVSPVGSADRENFSVDCRNGYFFLAFLLRIFGKRELARIRQQLPAGQE
jgi:hypothetical protein